MNKQKGVTLIEVLLALTILFIISAVVWNVFFQGMSFSKNVQTKTVMQQEANIILTAIRSLHQDKNNYKIYYIDTPNSSYIKLLDGSATLYEFHNSTFIYTIYRFENGEYKKLDIDNEYDIEPNIEDLPIKLVIESTEDANLSYEIQTYISKIRGH